MLTFKFDPSFIPGADRVHYDFSHNRVYVAYRGVYAFIFANYGIDDLAINDACYIAKLRVAQFVDRLALRLDVVDQAQQERIDAIISGVGMPMHWKYGQEKFWRDLDEGMQRSFMMGELERVSIPDKYEKAFQGCQAKIVAAKPYIGYEGFLPRYGGPLASGPFITGDTDMKKLLGEQDMATIKEMFKNPNRDTENNE